MSPPPRVNERLPLLNALGVATLQRQRRPPFTAATPSVGPYVGCGRLFNSEKSVSAHARRAHAERYHQVITEYNKQAGFKWSAVWKDFKILEVALETLELEEKNKNKEGSGYRASFQAAGSLGVIPHPTKKKALDTGWLSP